MHGIILLDRKLRTNKASFKRSFRILRGGAESGFRRVQPTKYTPRLLHFHGEKTRIEVKEVFILYFTVETNVYQNLIKGIFIDMKFH